MYDEEQVIIQSLHLMQMETECIYQFVLRKPTDIDGVDAWLQSVGWENMAFVFLNRYLDLSEVCDSDTVALSDELCYN